MTIDAFPLTLVNADAVDRFRRAWSGTVAEQTATLLTCRELWTVQEMLAELGADDAGEALVQAHMAQCDQVALCPEAAAGAEPEPAADDGTVPDERTVVWVTPDDGRPFPATADMAGYFRTQGYRITDRHPDEET
jgi:hypothetical protein